MLDCTLFIFFKSRGIIERVSCRTICTNNNNIRFHLMIAINSKRISRPRLLLLASLRAPRKRTRAISMRVLIITMRNSTFNTFLFRNTNINGNTSSNALKVSKINVRCTRNKNVFNTMLLRVFMIRSGSMNITHAVFLRLMMRIFHCRRIVIPAITNGTNFIRNFTRATSFRVKFRQKNSANGLFYIKRRWNASGSIASNGTLVELAP